MTAYRSAPPPVERPCVNPQLEAALLAYHRKHRRRDVVTIVVALCFVLAAVLCLIKHPVEARPIASFGVPGLFGLLIGAWSLWVHRPYLLERLRTGIPIRDVHRGKRTTNVTRDFPALYVDFKDGRTASLLGLGDDDLAHIEALLRIQMANGNEKLYDRLAELFPQLARSRP